MPAWVFPFLFSAFSHQAPSTRASSRSGQLRGTQTPTLPITWGQPGDRDPNPDRDEAVLQLIPTLSTPARRTDAAGPSLSARFLFQFIASHQNPTQTPTAGKLGNFFSSIEETKPFFCAKMGAPGPAAVGSPAPSLPSTASPGATGGCDRETQGKVESLNKT